MKKIVLIIVSIIISIVIGNALLPILDLQDDMMITQFWIVLTLSILMIITMFEDGICTRIDRDRSAKNNAKTYDYYREPLDEISPMMGAILLGKKIHEPDVVAAMILYLKRKGIDIEKTLTAHDLKNSKLRCHEEFFIENKNTLLKNFYEDGFNMYNNDYTYENFLNELTNIDLMEEGYLDINGNYGSGYKCMLFPTFYHMLHTLIMTGVPYTATSNYAITLKMIFTITTLSWCIIDIFVLLFDYHNKGNFTRKAYEYINKTKGAKRFLEDYSLISKREVKQEILFDSYVQTAIFLDMKGKLDDDVAKYYYNILDKYNKINKTRSFKFTNGNITLVGLIIYMLAWIWYPAEPAVNLMMFHIFGGAVGNVCITSLFFISTTNGMIKKYIENVKNNSKEEIEKRNEEADMIKENTVKINEALENNFKSNGIIVKNIYETDSTIEEIMEEAANLEDDND